MGYYRIAAVLAVLLLLPALLNSQQVKSHKYRFEDTEKSSDIRSYQKSITIDYVLPELDIISHKNENGTFYRILIPGHSPTADPGKPELPVLNHLITVPGNGNFNVKISEISSVVINPPDEEFDGFLYPAQEGETKGSSNQKKKFRLDKKIYSLKRLIASDTVRIEALGQIRGKKLANLIISPVRYNPSANYMEIITSMKIVITFEDDIMLSAKSGSAESLLFNESLGKGILNYYPEDLIPGYSDEPVEMIILTDTSFRKHLEPLYLWKTRKGFKLRILYRGKNYAGETYTELKASIENIYRSSSENGHPPEYLLIIGDVNRVPFYGTGYISDMYYGEFDGNGDYMPEMYIGRIPASDTNAVKSVVNKILQYEKHDFADTNTFYGRALVTTGRDATYGNYMNGQVKYAVTNYLKPENRINNYHFYYPEGHTKKDSIMKLISLGLSFINYTGHGNSSGWLHLEIKTPDIVSFRNKNMYPFVISNACRTAQFNDTASFGNKIVVAAGKGAIGFIGCSNDSYWDEDFYWSVGAGAPGPDPKYSDTGLGAYDRLFHKNGELPSEWMTTIGQVNFAGNLAVSSSPSSRKKYYWETYTVIGDPSITPIIGVPDPFDISLPDTLPPGIRSISLTVDPFAYVAISDFTTLWDASFASPSGSVVLNIPLHSKDSCLIVITGQNRIPLIKTVYFSDISGEFINLSGIVLDDYEANNNGKADYGEKLTLKIRISNLGMTAAYDLTASLTSSSPWVTINNGLINVGTVPSLSELITENGFELTIGDDIPDQGIITFDLLLKDIITSKQYKVDITVNAPRIEIINCILDDSVIGNNNFVADPGETFELLFQVANTGSSNTSGQLMIESPDANLMVLDPNIKSGILRHGEVTEIRVIVMVSEYANFGDFIYIASLLDCDPFIADKSFSFRVGRIRESFESASFSVFPWINISSKPWIISQSNAADGNFSARSGKISHNGSSNLMIRTVFPENDTLKFRSKVSSELNYDYLEFRLNGDEILRRSGETPWEKHSIPVSEGENKMEWTYVKDNSVSQGSDAAWIDLIDFSLSSQIKYIHKDIEVARIITPVQKEIYGQEPVTVKVLNIGRDTIQNFNLGYTINNTDPVVQSFNVQLIPYQDSVTLTFDRKADLGVSGIYDIKVFGHNNNDDFMRNDTAAISVENKYTEETFYVYPNPFGNKLNLVINSRSGLDVRISLVDGSGRRVIDFDQPLNEGANKIEISTFHLAPSYYILSISGGKFTKAVPLIKVRE